MFNRTRVFYERVWCWGSVTDSSVATFAGPSWRCWWNGSAATGKGKQTRAAASHCRAHSTAFDTLCIMWINCCLNIVQPNSQTTLNAVCQCLTSAMNYPCVWSMPENGLVRICVWTWKLLVKIWHVVRSLLQRAGCFNFLDSQKWKCLLNVLLNNAVIANLEGVIPLCGKIIYLL